MSLAPPLIPSLFQPSHLVCPTALSRSTYRRFPRPATCDGLSSGGSSTDRAGIDDARSAPKAATCDALHTLGIFKDLTLRLLGLPRTPGIEKSPWSRRSSAPRLSRDL